jgi:hypothetical protein
VPPVPVVTVPPAAFVPVTATVTAIPGAVALPPAATDPGTPDSRRSRPSGTQYAFPIKDIVTKYAVRPFG